LIPPTIVACAGRELSVADLGAPLPLDELVRGTAAWEVELGFGRGSYLLRRALAGGGRFLGVELAALYFRLLARRAARRGLTNLVAVRGEAQYVIAALLPRAFAAAVHVYFPDPWPKARHHRRRLLDPESLDLVLGVLQPGGRLYFATDHADYGEVVADVLSSYPYLELRRQDGPWPDGARTNYEAKYEREGRVIWRWTGTLARGAAPVHPAGRAGLLVAYRVHGDPE
jgi:tRNA (guanine-N7-)-methyltransferase